MCLLQAVFAIMSRLRSNISSCILYLHSNSSPRPTVFASCLSYNWPCGFPHLLFISFPFPKDHLFFFLRPVEVSFQNFCGSASLQRYLHPRNCSLHSKSHMLTSDMCGTFCELCLTGSNLNFFMSFWALFSQR